VSYWSLPSAMRQVLRDLEAEPLARHPGDDPADSGPAAEVLPNPGDDRWHAAGRVAEAERRQHGEQDAATLSEGAEPPSPSAAPRRRPTRRGGQGGDAQLAHRLPPDARDATPGAAASTAARLRVSGH